MTKKKLKGPKNQWEARLSKHNGVTGVLGDSRFGTALFTRLQLWTMLREESARTSRPPVMLDRCRERGRHWHFVRVATSVAGYRIPYDGPDGLSSRRALGANRRSGAHSALHEALENLVRIRYAPHLWYLTTGRRDEARS